MSSSYYIPPVIGYNPTDDLHFGDTGQGDAPWQRGIGVAPFDQAAQTIAAATAPTATAPASTATPLQNPIISGQGDVPGGGTEITSVGGNQLTTPVYVPPIAPTAPVAGNPTNPAGALWDGGAFVDPSNSSPMYSPYPITDTSGSTILGIPSNYIFIAAAIASLIVSAMWLRKHHGRL